MLIALAVGLAVMTAKVAPGGRGANGNSFEQLLDSARAGDPASQRMVGYHYFKGIDVKSDPEVAAKWWSKAALAGDAESTALLGICFQEGHGVERDSLMASRLFYKAIERGHPTLLADMADMASEATYAAVFLGDYYSGVTHRDNKKAEQFLTMAADAGSVDGKRKLALLMLNTRRAEKALDLFEQGAAVGDTVSLYYAGFIVGEPRFGVDGDKKKALEQMTKAADMGSHQAQYVLGCWLDEGRNVDPDYNEARRRWIEAARGGNDRARWSLGLSNAVGRPGIKPNYTIAYNWLTSTDPRLYTRTFRQLFADTATVVKDTPFNPYVQALKAIDADDAPDALEWFAEFGRMGAPEAETFIALVHYTDPAGSGSGDSLVAALDRAIELRDDPVAMVIKANYLLRQGKPDGKRIAALLDRAMEKGLGQAYALKGQLLARGKVFKADPAKAAELLEEAMFLNGLTDEAALAYAEILEDGAGGVKRDPAKAKALRDNLPEARRAAFLKAVPTSIK